MDVSAYLTFYWHSVSIIIKKHNNKLHNYNTNGPNNIDIIIMKTAILKLAIKNNSNKNNSNKTDNNNNNNDS